jgi:AmmeMemoRadiSam system protein B
MEREPAVAGRFYPAGREALLAEVTGFLAGPVEAPLPGGAGPDVVAALPALGMVAPHAGYPYSGGVAGAVYARVAVPDRAIVLCPNHTGRGEDISLWPEGAWRTPLGSVPVDAALTAELAAAGAALDVEAHRSEHALEVQLPFLQVRNPRVAIAALCLGPLDWPACRELGRAVAAAARRHGALVVASSDMSHYVPAEVARRKDALALSRVLALDPEGLHAVVRRERISMCGVIPATVMLVAALELGARSAELVRYGHSGETTGDDSSVVGYAGVVVR